MGFELDFEEAREEQKEKKEGTLAKETSVSWDLD